MLEFGRTSVQQQVVDACHALIDRPEFEQRAAVSDETRQLGRENLEDWRSAGLNRLALPPNYGGPGIGATGLMQAQMIIGGGDGSLGLGTAMHYHATGAVMLWPEVSEKLREFVAEEVDAGKFFCAGISEPGVHGATLGSLSPRALAHRVDGGYRLEGIKGAVTYVDAADYVYVSARVPERTPAGGAIFMLLPLQAALEEDEATIEQTWRSDGMRASCTNTLDLHGAWVPDRLVMHEVPDFVQAFLLQEGHLSTSYHNAYLGVLRAYLEESGRFLTNRVPAGYGQSMAYDPLAQLWLGEALAMLSGAESVQQSAHQLLDAEGPGPRVAGLLLTAKALLGRLTKLALAEVSEENGLSARTGRLDRLRRDAALAPIQPPRTGLAAQLLAQQFLGVDPRQVPALQRR